MSIKLQIGLLVVSLITMFFVVKNVVRNKMNIRYSLVWIVWGIVIVFMSVFPKTIYAFTGLIGIEKPVNTVFLIMIFLLYIMSYYLFLTISKQKEEISTLNYEVATLKKKIENNENNSLNKKRNESKI